MQAFSFFYLVVSFAPNLGGSCQWAIRLRNASSCRREVPEVAELLLVPANKELTTSGGN
jgi:hypothetical protein